MWRLECFVTARLLDFVLADYRFAISETRDHFRITTGCFAAVPRLADRKLRVTGLGSRLDPSPESSDMIAIHNCPRWADSSDREWKECAMLMNCDEEFSSETREGRSRSPQKLISRRKEPWSRRKLEHQPKTRLAAVYDDHWVEFNGFADSLRLMARACFHSYLPRRAKPLWVN